MRIYYLCVLYAPLSCLVWKHHYSFLSLCVRGKFTLDDESTMLILKHTKCPISVEYIFNHEEENECLKAWWHLHVYDSGGLVILLWRWSTFFLPLDTILSHHAVWYFQALMSQEVHVLRNLMSRTYLLQSEKWFYIGKALKSIKHTCNTNIIW